MVIHMKKRTTALLLTVVLCLCLCACSDRNPVGIEYSRESYIGIFNRTGRELKRLGLTRSFGGDAVGTTTVQNANGHPLGSEMLSFNLQQADVPDGADTSGFAMVLSVTEMDGAVYRTAAQVFPLKFGTDYFFVLTFDDGSYVLTREIPDTAGEAVMDPSAAALSD